MATSDQCAVCRALAQEIRDAYADLSDQAVRDAWLATHKMIGGTEDDAQRALLAKIDNLCQQRYS